MPKTAEELFKEADALDDQGKQLEAIKKFDEAILLKPDFAKAYFGKAFSLCSIGRILEGIEFYSKAIELDPKWAMAHFNKGTNLYDLGKKEEALECYNMAILHNPNHFDAHNNKGNTLFDFGRFEEAIKSYDIVVKGKPEYPYVYQGKGNTLYALGRKEEALECFNKAVTLVPKHPLFLCNRGKCLHSLGKTKEAMKDLNKVEDLMKKGEADMLSQASSNYINATLPPLIGLHRVADTVENLLKESDQSNPVIKKVIEQVKELQGKKMKATSEVLDNLEKKGANDTDKPIDQIDILNTEFLKYLDIIKAANEKQRSEARKVQPEGKETKAGFQDIKDELSNKLEDYGKKLDIELKKSDLSSENQGKIKEYFNAFVETFSSAYATSQATDSADLKTDSDSIKASILSFAASFGPFISSVLSSQIKSLKGFLESGEVKTNAKKMKALVVSTGEMSQLIGKTGFLICTNVRKQQQIIGVSSGDLSKASGSVFEKISQFCKQLEDEVDAFLYSGLYRTPAAKLGHNDGNALIQVWLEGKVEAYNAESVFVKTATEFEKVGAPEHTEKIPKDASGRSRCCNMF